MNMSLLANRYLQVGHLYFLQLNKVFPLDQIGSGENHFFFIAF